MGLYIDNGATSLGWNLCFPLRSPFPIHDDEELGKGMENSVFTFHYHTVVSPQKINCFTSQAGQLGRAEATRNPGFGILVLYIICFFQLGHGHKNELPLNIALIISSLYFK